MDKNQFQTNWNQLKSKVKEKFVKLSDADMQKISGKKDELIAKLQNLYGMNKEKAENQVRDIENAFYAEEFRNHWNEFQSKLKQKWNSMSEDDIRRIKGSCDRLIAHLQERFHFDRSKAEVECYAFIESARSHKEPAAPQMGKKRK